MRTIARYAALSCALVVLLSVGAIGCGSGQDSKREDAAHARAYVIDHLKTRFASFTRLPPWYRSAEDLLGNAEFAGRDQAQAKALTEAVVVGRITDVQPGYGFAAPESGVKGTPFYDSIMIPFDSKDALWRTVHLTFAVDEVLSGDIPRDTDQIRIGLGIGDANTDEQHIKDGLIALGQTVWFLQRESWPGFAYDKSLYSDVEAGRLIAQVRPDNTLAFPMMDEPSARALGHPTLDQLRTAASRPPHVVQLHQEGNIWTR